MAAVVTLLEGILFGLALGMIYLMVALGLTLIFGLMEVINFAHGALVTLGAYIGMTTWNVTGNYWVALIILMLSVGVLGAVLERSLVKRLYGYNPLYQLLLTFGVAFIVEGLIVIQYGEGGQQLSTPGFTDGSPIDIGPAVMPRYRLYIIIFTLVLLSIVWVVLQRSRLGLIIKAGIEDRERIQLLGVKLGRINMIVFAAGSALAAAAGFLAGPILGVNPNLGSELLIISFAIVIIGGLGSIRGTVVASLLLGIVFNVSLFFYPAVADAMIFFVMGLVLVVMPDGLFGEGEI